MSVVSYQVTMTANQILSVELELSRPYLKRAVIQYYGATADTDNLQMRITNGGLDVFPMISTGSNLYAYLYRHARMLDIEIARDMIGPPYIVTLDLINNSTGAGNVSVLLETYFSRYAKVRVKAPEGFSLEPAHIPGCDFAECQFARCTKDKLEKCGKC